MVVFHGCRGYPSLVDGRSLSLLKCKIHHQEFDFQDDYPTATLKLILIVFMFVMYNASDIYIYIYISMGTSQNLKI